MKQRRWVLTLLVVPILGLACQRQSNAPETIREGDEAAPARPRQERFVPPPTGKLTPRQMEMYITVQKSTLEQQRGASPRSVEDMAITELAKLATADLQIAEAMGYDPAEYRWVKDRVIEARLPAEATVNPVARALQAASLQALEKRRDETEDPQARERLDAQIAEIGARLSDTEREDDSADQEALAHNRKLREQFGAELEALEKVEAPIPFPPAPAS